MIDELKGNVGRLKDDWDSQDTVIKELNGEISKLKTETRDLKKWLKSLETQLKKFVLTMPRLGKIITS